MKRLSRLLLAMVVVGGVLLYLGIGGIRDNLQPVQSYETVTTDQIKKGAVISGEVKMNLGNFAEEYNTRNGVKTGSSYYYAIMVGDKVMALRCGNNNKKNILDTQANQFTRSLSSWDDVQKALGGSDDSKDQDTKKNSKKNKNKKSEEKQTEETDTTAASSIMPVQFKGVVSKMDSDVLKYLNEYLTPTGSSQPVLEIIPYEVSISMMTMGASVGMTIGGLVLVLLTVLVFVKLRK